LALSPELGAAADLGLKYAEKQYIFRELAKEGIRSSIRVKL
jgi:hypothetical protein